MAYFMQRRGRPPDMKVGALIGWFGSKRALAMQIVEEMGPHRSYWNLTCGGIAVEMNKVPAAMEHINDIHGEMYNLAVVVQDEKLGPRLYRRLRRTLAHERVYKNAAEVLLDPKTEALERAWAFFVRSWLGHNGAAGTKRQNYQMAVRFCAGGGHAATRFRHAVDSIPAFRRRLRRMTILNRDLFELLPRIKDEKRTVIYVDPPYHLDGKERRGHDLYLHEFTKKDHIRLAEMLRRFRHARVLVSYYEQRWVRSLYPDWTIRRLESFKNMGRQNNQNRCALPSKEILFINQPSLVIPHPASPVTRRLSWKAWKRRSSTSSKKRAALAATS